MEHSVSYGTDWCPSPHRSVPLGITGGVLQEVLPAKGVGLPVSGLCLPLSFPPPPPQVSVSLLSCPFPFPSLRAAVFGGDYAVLTLEYELGKSRSQILESGKARGRQGSRRGRDICVAAAPDA